MLLVRRHWHRSQLWSTGTGREWLLAAAAAISCRARACTTATHRWQAWLLLLLIVHGGCCVLMMVQVYQERGTLDDCHFCVGLYHPQSTG